MGDKRKKQIVEFRKDIVSGEWILISSKRQFRPILFSKKKGKGLTKDSLKDCPFEDLKKSKNSPPILWYTKDGSSNFDKWFVQVVPNKYPMLFLNDVCPVLSSHGPHSKTPAVGSHEIVITRDHNRPIDKMTVEEIGLVVKTFQERYKALEHNKCVEYVFIFHNQGELAGASVYHPHSQLIALPIVPPDVFRSINGGLEFFKENNKCVHCTMLEWEKKEKKRVIYKNKHFIAFAPYASRVSYEIRIFPIKHSSNFEEMEDKHRLFFAEALKKVLAGMNKALKNPDYNFFIHTVSAKIKNVPYYHWHLEILPRTEKWAGVELGTGIEVVTIPPEEAAERLRKAI